VILSVAFPAGQFEKEESVVLHPGDPPGIFIAARAFHRLKLLLRLCPAEIAGLGDVAEHQKGFLIQDVFVLPQRVTDSEAELDPEALFGFLARFVADGGDPSSIQFWWHSHGDGEVYWSETDLETIESFPGARVISVVGNRQGELLCRLDLFAPRRERMENLPIVEEACGVAPLDLESIRQEILAEIKTKVRLRLPMEPLIDHEGVVGFVSYAGYEIPIEPDDKAPAVPEEPPGARTDGHEG
jgi:hypothetical protein